MPDLSRIYTPDEIAQAMADAGFPLNEIPIGQRIVQLESSGRSDALNDRPGIEYSRGPWQINLLAHPDVSNDCASDLACSTRFAYKLWSEQGWAGPWHTTWLKIVGGPNDPDNPYNPRSSALTPSSTPTPPSTTPMLTAGAYKDPLTTFTFPKLDLFKLPEQTINYPGGSIKLGGPVSVDTKPLVAIAVALGAIGLVFVGTVKLTGVSIGPIH